MTTTLVRPTGVHRTFGADEIIVSKTDPRGRMTYVNDVFVRVSRYPEAELIGRPHNMIRHPEMPRALFAMLWTEIQAGREVFAYINNLAADGANYWVLANVTPTYARGSIIGYHSNRRLPSSRAVAAVEPIYAALVAEERRHTHVPDAIRASSELLVTLLAERAMTYDQFVWTLDPGAEQ